MPGALTLAVMVRDDARRLDRCLTSLKDHVSEIAVLDTGSVDDTVAVAESHRARVQKIEWPNDFGRALNVLLAMVHTPWTLRLDSDEWMDPKEAGELRNLVKEDSTSAFRLIRRDLNAAGGYAEIHVMRLWRTHEKIRYTGIVHETIPANAIEEAWPGKHMINTDVFLWHDGYATDVAGKVQRNIELLRREVADNPDRLEAQAMLATTLVTSKNPEGMGVLESLIDKLLDLDLENPPPQVAMAFVVYMGGVPESEVKAEKTERTIRKACHWYPKNPAILYYAGILEKERGDLEAAFKHLLKLEARVELGDYDRSIPIPREFLGEKLYQALGFVASQLGRHDVAQRCHRRMLMARTQRP
jgi:glycosyltransferase involved in cell wall biosynthesis